MCSGAIVYVSNHDKYGVVTSIKKRIAVVQCGDKFIVSPVWLLKIIGYEKV